MVEPGKRPIQVGPIFSAFPIRGERTESECLLMHAISWSWISFYIFFDLNGHLLLLRNHNDWKTALC